MTKITHLVPFRLIALFWLTFAAGTASAACPGCCSSHGGIAALCASNGRIYCADGTVSPSCTCASCGVSTPTVPVTPTCSGGRIWNGSACACTAGQQWASIEQVCHTPLPATACGVERWDIKTGSDAGATGVNTTPLPITIDLLLSIIVPAGATRSPTRVAPVETSTFVLDGTLTDYRMTEDSDYHLVVMSKTGKTMIAEIPHASCVSAVSPFKPQIAAVRAAVDAAVAPRTSFKTVSAAVRLTGIGFWDDLHGQQGVAANGVELHPLTQLLFDPATALTTNANNVAVEYFHAGFGHYFITASADEANAIDSGKVSGWTRTGQAFPVNALGASGTAKVCRFFSTRFAPKSSHFYTPSVAECAVVKTNPDWQYEGDVFSVGLPTFDGKCAAGTRPLYRLYNNGQSGAPNHRYTTSIPIRATMLSEGWVPEGYGADGVIACVPN